MRYAPVVPPRAIAKLKPRDDLAYFIFADFAWDLEPYRKWFVDKQWLVMDCPIYEHGTPLGPHALKALMREFSGLEFAIMPDVIDDMQATLNQFYDYIVAIDSPACTGVVQGKTLLEALHCAMEMLDYGVRRLAIPNKRAWSRECTRSRFVELITLARQIDVKWHFLGGDYPYADDQLAAGQLPQVISLDTAEPINAAIAGFKMHSHRLGVRSRNPEFLNMRPGTMRGDKININIGEMQEWLNSLSAIPTE